MKKIMFRMDGNASLGAGHVMRCLSLGMAARSLNIQCLFVVADNSFADVFVKNEFQYIVLNTDYSNMNSELSLLFDLIDEYLPDVVLVDSYYVTFDYLLKIKQKVKLAYIDDVKKFAYPVNCLINYNSEAIELDYSEWYQVNQVDKPCFMLGNSYVPLRKEFSQNKRYSISNEVTDIFFSAGGGDEERFAIRFLKEIICREAVLKYTFHIVLGAFEPDIDEIMECTKKYSNIKIYYNVSEISKIMQQCDVAISASGFTLYELCACGVPTISYVLADNQILGERSLCNAGVIIGAGDVRLEDQFWNQLFDNLYLLCENYDLRKAMGKRAREIIDGRGAERIIQEITKL